MVFPREQIERAIRDEIAKSSGDRPTPRRAWEPDVDSLVMVMVAIRIEAELDVTIPEEILPAGGYDNVENCVRAFVEMSKNLWRERQKERGEPVT